MQKWLISISSCRPGISDCIENTHILIHKAKSLLGALNQNSFDFPSFPRPCPPYPEKQHHGLLQKEAPVPRTKNTLLHLGWHGGCVSSFKL